MSIDLKVETRGRKRKVTQSKGFNSNNIKLVRGNQLIFKDELFHPLKTSTEVDQILSTEGGLMPATNMIFTGGPGSGKSTLVLDMLSSFTLQGYKCLFVSGEMDEIAYYKYCKRMPQFDCVQTLFLKNYSEDVKSTLEYVFNLGYDVIAIDSLAEVLDMYRDVEKCTMGAAELWLLGLQDKNKKGQNIGEYYTAFINIQQQTKAGDFAGSNRLKHMTDAMCHIERSKDGLERSMHFSKNRDCDKDFKMYFSFYENKIHYTYPNI
jgi:predicted ATP-dependent serine protease